MNRHGVAAGSIIANPDVYYHTAVYGPERDFSPHHRRRVAVYAGLFAIELNGYCPRSAKSVTSLAGAIALPDYNRFAGCSAVCGRRRLGVMAAGRSVRLDCRPLAGRSGGAVVTGMVAGVFCQYRLA